MPLLSDVDCESNPGDLWKILNKFKRSKREDKIDIDELYEYF
jgi:hypothetical protein